MCKKVYTPPTDKFAPQVELKGFCLLKAMGSIPDAVGLVYSRSGFSQTALHIFKEHHMAYSDDERWLD